MSNKFDRLARDTIKSLASAAGFKVKFDHCNKHVKYKLTNGQKTVIATFTRNVTDNQVNKRLLIIRKDLERMIKCLKSY